ncbi:transmembrane protein 135 isoform X1 [Neodiprion pinetum]|uniref:transmembrane protein 135 isoform X1 n=1 Tax=Neodiprion pinetum TaxID=441929 RepID=UPI001EDF44E2|nr:transmembrane protein 135-like [Neodiprion pinetum]XP_046485270.1 transmembrane protein 135-like [Neodiprion pinetum]XP_046485271.1 transmembrane protein 135-like [Neodiprion pinetum]XP_046485272.1 transmembrane protein 135-like [Neodiprion pinetum]
MPPRLSKFSISATCIDYVHPWTNSCVSATAGLGLHALQESLRIYTTVYLVTLLMKGRIPSKDDIRRTVLGVLQSTAFLSWSAFSYSIFLCFLRRISGNFNILTVSFLPSFLSNLAAIVIERPSRRTLLCLYVSNIATETVFRAGVWRGYFSVIPRGEVYIFAASIAMMLYYFRSEKNQQDSIFKILQFVIGPYERYNCSEIRREPHTLAPKCSQKRRITNKSNNQIFNACHRGLAVYKHVIERLKARHKHLSCPHPFSCAHYVISGGTKLFGIGIGVQLAIKLVLQWKKIFGRPKIAKQIIFRRENLYLGMFIGGFTGIYRMLSCGLRRAFGKDSRYYAIPAGIAASVAFTMYPDNTIALYVMWKALQILWNSGVATGKLPEVKWFMIVLYCFSTAILFHAAIIEPQNLRSSYWKFLHNLSGGRIATMARKPLDEFGLGTSASLAEVLRKTQTTDQISYSF